MNYRDYVVIVVLIWASFGLARTVRADAGDITVHTVSVHVGASGLNNINPGVAYDLTDRLRLGALLNSFGKPSAYAAYLIPLGTKVRVGVGAVTGYQYKDGRVLGKTASAIPMLAVEVDVTKHVSVLWFGQALNLELKF